MIGTVTSKGQVVIPAAIRRRSKISAGTRVRFESIRGGIAIYPQYADDVERAKGLLAGLKLPPNVERDPEREIV
jgi:AbrB family looped-hinge helix DNA binding protein